MSDRTGNVNGARDREIFSVKPDGTDERSLVTFDREYDRLDDVSSDGTKVAFTSSSSGNNEIFVMNADGSGRINVTNNPADDAHPRFFADSNKLAFRPNRTGNYDIYVCDLVGGQLVNVTNDPGYDELGLSFGVR
jgi:TolB protein